MPSGTAQPAVRALFRRCLRSAQRIPDGSQRAAYVLYVRDGFRRQAGVPFDAREAQAAYAAGLEQVESMEYYQAQVRRERSKTRADVAPTASPPPAPRKETHHAEPSGEAEHEAIGRWLARLLPHSRPADRADYARRLVDDGFDSVAFIEEELTEEDLAFMKKAHRRVVERQLQEKRGGA